MLLREFKRYVHKNAYIFDQKQKYWSGSYMMCPVAEAPSGERGQGLLYRGGGHWSMLKVIFYLHWRISSAWTHLTWPTSMFAVVNDGANPACRPETDDLSDWFVLGQAVCWTGPLAQLTNTIIWGKSASCLIKINHFYLVLHIYTEIETHLEPRHTRKHAWT